MNGIVGREQSPLLLASKIFRSSYAITVPFRSSRVHQKDVF